MDVSTLLDAQITILEARTWDAGTEPAQIIFGPIPPVLGWPVIGVLAPSGDAGDNDLATDIEMVAIYWTIEIPVTPDGSGAHYRTLIEIDTQLRALIIANPQWGLGDDVEDTFLRGWTTEISQQETGGQLLQTLTRRMEVRTYDR